MFSEERAERLLRHYGEGHLQDRVHFGAGHESSGHAILSRHKNVPQNATTPAQCRHTRASSPRLRAHSRIDADDPAPGRHATCRSPLAAMVGTLICSARDPSGDSCLT